MTFDGLKIWMEIYFFGQALASCILVTALGVTLLLAHSLAHMLVWRPLMKKQGKSYWRHGLKGLLPFKFLGRLSKSPSFLRAVVGWDTSKSTLKAPASMLVLLTKSGVYDTLTFGPTKTTNLD